MASCEVISIYLRPEFIEIFKEFDKMLSKDPEFIAMVDKRKHSLRSVAICILIARYVNAKKKITSEKKAEIKEQWKI